jgi:hypothetical protein
MARIVRSVPGADRRHNHGRPLSPTRMDELGRKIEQHLEQMTRRQGTGHECDRCYEYRNSRMTDPLIRITTALAAAAVAGVAAIISRQHACEPIRSHSGSGRTALRGGTG